MVCKSRLKEEYELDYSAQTVFDCLKDSLENTKIVRAHPIIKEIDEARKTIECITPAYKTTITVVPILQDKSTVKFFLKPQFPAQMIDLWNRNKKNVKAIMNQLSGDLEKFDGSSKASSKEVSPIEPVAEKNIVSNDSKQVDVKGSGGLIHKLFYWSDGDGNVRPAKTKIISISFMVLLVVWDQLSFNASILASIIVALILTLPVFIIGYIIHFILSRR